MKKRLISFLLTAALALTLSPAALALGAFADVGDAETARNVEVLRLMGVLEGDNRGNFRPDSSLTRAEFTKMAVVLTGKKNVAVTYGSRNVGFLDMKKHWATGYVNYAASKEVGLIHGMPDGTFAPNRAITYGEAVAILARLLGYNDKDTGGIWPDGYIALASAAGMTKGLSIAGGAAINRAQAAKLFVNALSSENAKGETLYALLGYSRSKEETVLYSIDLANSKMRTQAGNYDLADPKSSSVLNSLKGYVLFDGEEKAVTFLPSASTTTGTAVSDGAIIVSANGSVVGLDALTGGAEHYSVFRNGVPTTTAGLKKNDVVIYNASGNAILACDARVPVYYENCAPSPAAPNTVTVLGGTEFRVLPTAQQSLSRFKPSDNMTLLLTADGRVAGATEGGGDANALAFVSSKGEVSLLCGDSLLPLNAQADDKLKMDTDKVLGEVVRISQNGGNGKSTISLSERTGVSGDLDPVRRTLGTRSVADGAMVFTEDKLTTLAALDKTVVPQGRIGYARTNDAGEVDLIVIKNSSNALYGRAIVTTESRYDSFSGRDYRVRFLSIKTYNNQESQPIETALAVEDGAYVEARLNGKGDGYASVTALKKLTDVPASAWVSENVVNYGDQTYVISDKVICCNRDSGGWFEDLDAAKAYGGTMDLYVKDGTVHVIEVRT